jgi:acetylornithine/N-succinyldiaminopimelate aminotransferase
VTSLGHAHPRLVKALTEQASKVWQISNHFRIANQEKFAEKLVAATFADRAFFCNSGLEACEMAVKMARRYHYGEGRPEKYRIITFEGAFHGRSLGMIAAGGNPKYMEGFGPKAEGFDHIAAGDLGLVERTIFQETAGIFIEPVMGEGGVRTPSMEFLKGLRALCDKYGILLVLDEVQSGMGRCGYLFAHEAAGIKPDILAAAKGIGGGFPLGAVLATEAVAKHMTPGTHGSTYGGNPLGTAVGAEVLDIMLEPGFLEGVRQKGLRMKQRLAEIKDRYPGVVEEVRGMGLLMGLRLKPPVGDVQKACFAQKLLAIPAGDNVLRLLPALNISDEELNMALDRLSAAIDAVAKAA